MRSLSIACALLLLATVVEILTGCGIEENGKRRREVVFITYNYPQGQSQDALPDLPSDEQHASTPIANPETEQPQTESPIDSDSNSSEPVPRFGIRDFVQINATMERLTGVPSTTASIKTVYVNDLITQLPTNNDMHAFLASHQVGISKLATEYCDVLMANTTLRAALLAGLNFTQVPATALNDNQANNVSVALLDRFWGPQLEFHSDRAAAIADMKSLILDLVKTAPAATATETLNIVKGACTAALASSSVSTL